MKRQILAFAATVAIATSAFAHSTESMINELESNPLTKGVTLGAVVASGWDATFGLNIVVDMLKTAQKGIQCGISSRDGKRDSQGGLDLVSDLTPQEYVAFSKRMQKTLTCAVQTAEGMAFVVLDYSTKGVVNVLVLGGKAFHYVGRAGKHVRQESQSAFGKLWKGIIRGGDLALFAPMSTTLVLPIAGVIGGTIAEGLGELGYVLTIEAAKRIDVIMKTSQGVIRNATYVGTELATGAPTLELDQNGEFAASNALAVVAGVFNLIPNVLASKDDKRLADIINDSQNKISIKVEKIN